jgi:hypothetical protein
MTQASAACLSAAQKWALIHHLFALLQMQRTTRNHTHHNSTATRMRLVATCATSLENEHH